MSGRAEKTALPALGPVPYVFDLELTSLCNTHCAFCPREGITRAAGRMTPEIFALFLQRLQEYLARLEGRSGYLPAEQARFPIAPGEASPVRVVLCGMGEALTHPQAPEWLGRIRRETGVRASVVTNGLLLEEPIIERLAQARVTVIVVSVPGIDRESYERIMRLKWETVLANIRRANRLLPERIEVSVTIPRGARFGPAEVVEFWQQEGVRVGGISACHSRGGFLHTGDLVNARPPSGSFCGVIARHNFITWDGQVLSCCHDLGGENVLGTLRDDSFLEIAARKRALFQAGPSFRTCARCDDDQRAERGGILCMQLP